MAFMPMAMEVQGWPVRVVGGGLVAARKLRSLLQAGADVTVIAPHIHPDIDALAKVGRIRWEARPYRDGDLAGARLVVAATDDPAVNAAVAAAARAAGQLLNAADDPAACTVQLGATLRRGGLTLGVFTGGSSPALARAIRDELEARFAPDFGEVVADLATARRRILEQVPEEDRDPYWHNLLKGPFLLPDGATERQREHIAQCMSSLSA